MAHPLKQGLKHLSHAKWYDDQGCRNGTSTKTRIETVHVVVSRLTVVGRNGTSTKTRIETNIDMKNTPQVKSRNGTSTKTRIETDDAVLISASLSSVEMAHPLKQGLKRCKINTCQ